MKNSSYLSPSLPLPDYVYRCAHRVGNYLKQLFLLDQTLRPTRLSRDPLFSPRSNVLRGSYTLENTLDPLENAWCSRNVKNSSYLSPSLPLPDYVYRCAHRVGNYLKRLFLLDQTLRPTRLSQGFQSCAHRVRNYLICSTPCSNVLRGSYTLENTLDPLDNAWCSRNVKNPSYLLPSLPLPDYVYRCAHLYVARNLANAFNSAYTFVYFAGNKIKSLLDRPIDSIFYSTDPRVLRSRSASIGLSSLVENRASVQPCDAADACMYLAGNKINVFTSLVIM